MGDEFKFSDYVVKSIRNRGMKNKWFADILDVTESSFSYKIKNDSFTIVEVLSLCELLDISLNSVQSDFKEFTERLKEKEATKNAV